MASRPYEDLVLYGGFGRDWIFNPHNEKHKRRDGKRLAWHTGMGMYGGDLNGTTAIGEFALLIDYPEMEQFLVAYVTVLAFTGGVVLIAEGLAGGNNMLSMKQKME